MSRIFAYCRVSTYEQTTENQVKAIKAAGYDVEPQRVIEETVSGGVAAMARPAFQNLVNHKMEAGDTLTVLKLDRLGRDNIDVQNTIAMLQAKKIRVVCLDLPEPDLESAAGKLIVQLFAAFAEFEKNRISERTKEGLARARGQGKQIGRPPATDTAERVQAMQEQGRTQEETARITGLSLRTVQRHWIKSKVAKSENTGE